MERLKMGFWGKIKGFMVSPTETFNTVKEEGWGGSIGYFAKLLIILAILIAVIIVAIFAAIWGMIEAFIPAEVPGLGGFLGMAAGIIAVFMLISIIIGGIIGILVGSLWMHIWVYAVGGRKGVGQTIKSMAYGSTPSLVLGWIPFLGIIGVIWSIVVSIIGIRQLHEISTGRAVLAYIIGAIIIPIIIVIVIFIALLGTMPAPT
jgi:hypothetical protein